VVSNVKDNEDRVSLKEAIIIVLKRRLNLKSLLFFALLISFNSFAWFVYSNKVATGVDVHVKSWNISFEMDNEQLMEEVSFSVSEMYPGMDDYRDEIRIKNVGETDGKLTYELLSIRIMDTEYVVSDDGYTSEELLNSLKNDYPFTIDVGVTNSIVSHGGGEEAFYFSVVWPYESGDDESDTEWGKKAYDYYESNPDGSIIELKLRITALQA
jgi:hypothetical protein